MRSKAPTLAPIFRSKHQAELLATVLLHPDREYTLTQLASRVGASLPTISADVSRLSDAGVLDTRAVGRARLVRVNPRSRLTRPLTDLLLATYGPAVVVADEFADVPDVDRVLIFGSWAARYAGEPGPAPADVDVLVVGAPERQAVYDAADRAEQRLGWPVNPRVIRTQRWEAEVDDVLVRQIKSAPTLHVLPATETPP
jgi:DNA-binding transcriptional ArsR family regulator